MTALAKVEKLDSNISLYSRTNRGVPSGKELMEIVETTKLLATCPYYQKLGGGGVLAIWLTAREMGLPPMMCLNGGMYTFSGQVTLSSKLMNMMIINAGHEAKVLEMNDNKCKIRFKRCDRPKEDCTFDYEYTIQMAETAGLVNKQNWKTNRRDMLFNRCLSGGANKFMPDATMGAYLIGEMPGDGNIIDTIPENIEILKEDVKPFYIEEKKVISSAQAIELLDLLSQCSEAVRNNILGYIKKEYKIDMIDDLPLGEFEKYRELCAGKAVEYQKKLADAESQKKLAEAEIFNIMATEEVLV